ncbi:hypothetical protein ACFQGE_15360 [Halomicroarcula sp. GCM10025817]|uniref:hypothetical protein n=1 Tax=Haloarcula TaxID=2237 RepID=UPI0023E88324|nr:hypothetical protein [Halomicroarcula sp. SYNS111]
MDRLSSCYFCGVAHDVSLSEYPVVPKQLHPSEQTQQTVVLCSSCRRKLATVVETVVTAARADQARSEGPTTSDTAAADDDTSGLLDESGLEPQPDPTVVGDANETPVDDSPEAGADTEGTAEPSAAASAGEPGETTSTGSAAETDDGAVADDHDADEAGAATASDTEEDASANGADDDQPSLTRLEYSKVMRLLQNRPFPVDRAEIREVAVNAYDIDPEQFDAITEAAIERGLIGEEDGQFVSTE